MRHAGHCIDVIRKQYLVSLKWRFIWNIVELYQHIEKVLCVESCRSSGSFEDQNSDENGIRIWKLYYSSLISSWNLERSLESRIPMLEVVCHSEKDISCLKKSNQRFSQTVCRFNLLDLKNFCWVMKETRFKSHNLQSQPLSPFQNNLSISAWHCIYHFGTIRSKFDFRKCLLKTR